MRHGSCESVMGEEPTVEAFMRHLQVCVEEARTIADRKEREQRLWQLESAIQEAIIYKNRVEELQRHGIDPIRLVEAESPMFTTSGTQEGRGLAFRARPLQNVQRRA